MPKNIYNTIIIGAGAAGLMAAIEAGRRGRRVLLLEHTDKIGEKIRISGGGRCNFTNLFAAPKNYLSQNPHFVKSALSQYTQADFIKLMESYNIAYHEKTLGQLFCDGSAKQIIAMLLDLCAKFKVEIRLSCTVTEISKIDKFICETNQGIFKSESLVIATGGLSIPQLGASDFGYKLARKFGHKIVQTRPALVPLLVGEKDKEFYTSLSGVSNNSVVTYKKTSFPENILFTHRGLSGPAILQISSYLEKFDGAKIAIDLLPNLDLKQKFIEEKNNKQIVSNFLKPLLTNRLVENLALKNPDYNKSLVDLKKDNLIRIADKLHNFEVEIAGSEGYKKAEVTIGGVDTNQLSSKTMESKLVPNLFFIGEVVDVTGWLGGYNFQWAWSSGFAAGQGC